MLKKLLIGIVVFSCIMGVICYENYYYDMYIDKEETIITGLKTTFTSLATKKISNNITITNGRNRDLLLQMYNSEDEDWDTKETYTLNDEETQEITIEYPNDWQSLNNSDWRIIVDEGDTVEGFESEAIHINTTNRQNISLVAKSVLIMNKDTNQIYYQKSMNTKRSIASTTKILTCLVALENSELNDEVRITSEAVTTHLSRLRGVGDKVSMKDLLYAAMLGSDNGAAVAIAQHIGGSLTGFAKIVNQRLKELGCTNSHFTNPAGFTAKNHYFTAYDLAIITQAAYQNDTLRKIVRTKSYSFTTLKKNNQYTYNNTNKLLGTVSGVTGMKTGTTYAAGKCLVATYEHNKNTYIIVVLGSSETGRWEDTKKLIKYIDKYC